MSKALRLSEKWFQRGLWVVAIVFAWFLIGLGRTVVGDLPKVEATMKLDDFMDRAAAQSARDAIQADQRSAQEARDALARARLQLQVAQSDVAAQRASFTNWIATRQATQLADQDPDVIARTRALDALAAREREARAAVETQQKAQLDAEQSTQQARRQLTDMERAAQGAYQHALRAQQLRVFGYRLALTLPLLLIAGWLFRRHRRSRWWPFVWGFIIFALFAFFVELVPYLPSYGGYVRYLVGIAVTALVGRWAIAALQGYLERQRAAEAEPDQRRRQQLGYDTALARMAQGVCPGCERTVDLKNPEIDFCPHCGIGLFDRCGHCRARKNAFSRFCHACGTAAAAQPGPASATPAI